jgi:hypothetical protein
MRCIMLLLNEILGLSSSFHQTHPIRFHTLVLKLASLLDVGQLYVEYCRKYHRFGCGRQRTLTLEMNEFDRFAADKKTKESTPAWQCLRRSYCGCNLHPLEY